MPFETWLYLTSLAFCVTAAGMLVFYKHFPDKILGRTGLVIIIITGVSVINDVLTSEVSYNVFRTTLIFSIGTALVLVRMVIAHFEWWKEDKSKRQLF